MTASITAAGQVLELYVGQVQFQANHSTTLIIAHSRLTFLQDHPPMDLSQRKRRDDQQIYPEFRWVPISRDVDTYTHGLLISVRMGPYQGRV